MTDLDPMAATRKALLDRLVYMHRVLSYIDERWAAKEAVSRRYQASRRMPSRWSMWLVLPWAAGFVILLAAIATPIIQAWAMNDAYSRGRMAYPNIEFGNVAIMMIPLAVGFAFLVVGLRNKLYLPRAASRTEQANQQIEAANAAVWVDEQHVNAQLEQAGRDFAQHVGFDFFPEDYLTEDVVLFVIDAVRNQRANTVGQALNLYEQHAMHHAQMEESKRMRRQVAFSTVASAAMTGAAIGTMRAEGRATRGAMASEARANRAAAERIASKPVNVNVRLKGGW